MLLSNLLSEINKELRHRDAAPFSFVFSFYQSDHLTLQDS